MIAKPDRLAIGTGDSVRCVIGLLLPAWWIPASVIVGVLLVFRHGGTSAMDIAAFAGFGIAVSVEALRRIVLLTRPTGGIRATRWLRAIATTLLVAAAPVFLLLLLEGIFGCFTRACVDTVSLGIAQYLSGLSMLGVPFAWGLLRHSPWLRPR